MILRVPETIDQKLLLNSSKIISATSPRVKHLRDALIETGTHVYTLEQRRYPTLVHSRGLGARQLFTERRNVLIMTNDPNLHWDGTRWLRWDGTEWVDASAKVSPATYPAPPDPMAPLGATNATSRPWLWPVVAVAGVVVFGFIVIVGLAAAGGGGSTATPSTSTTSSAPSAPIPTLEPTPEPTVPAAPAAPQMTVSQENALAKAEEYLDYTAFSKSGLVKQLKYEGFSTADANFAVANIQVDWNEQAAKIARNYMDQSSFSRSSLINQLKYEGFTAAQAAYGAKSVGL